MQSTTFMSCLYGTCPLVSNAWVQGRAAEHRKQSVRFEGSRGSSEEGKPIHWIYKGQQPMRLWGNLACQKQALALFCDLR